MVASFSLQFHGFTSFTFFCFKIWRVFALFATHAWLIWYARNKLAHEGSCSSESFIAHQALQYIEEFQGLHKLSSPSFEGLPQVLSPCFLLPPESRTLKANTD